MLAGNASPLRDPPGAQANQRPAKRRSARTAAAQQPADGAHPWSFLFDPIASNASGLAVALGEWATMYRATPNDACARLVEAILAVAGMPGAVNPGYFEDESTMGELPKELEMQYNPETAGPCLLTSGTGKPRGRASSTGQSAAGRNYVAFCQKWATLAARIAVDDGDVNLLSVLRLVMAPLSASAVRAFRHVATVFVLHAATVLCQAAKRADRDFAQVVQQLGTAAEGADRRANLEQRRAQLEEQKTALETLIEGLFDAVYIHRSRDVFDTIRAACAAELGRWVAAYPELFLANTYLRYLGWALSDKVSAVRASALGALLTVYGMPQSAEALQAFTHRFAPRLVEMAVLDVDSDVQALAVRVLDRVAHAGLLLRDQLERLLVLLVGDASDATRATVARLAGELLNESVLELQERHPELDDDAAFFRAYSQLLVAVQGAAVAQDTAAAVAASAHGASAIDAATTASGAVAVHSDTIRAAVAAMQAARRQLEGAFAREQLPLETFLQMAAISNAVGAHDERVWQWEALCAFLQAPSLENLEISTAERAALGEAAAHAAEHAVAELGDGDATALWRQLARAACNLLEGDGEDTDDRALAQLALGARLAALIPPRAWEDARLHETLEQLCAAISGAFRTVSSDNQQLLASLARALSSLGSGADHATHAQEHVDALVAGLAQHLADEASFAHLRALLGAMDISARLSRYNSDSGNVVWACAAQVAASKGAGLPAETVADAIDVLLLSALYSDPQAERPECVAELCRSILTESGLAVSTSEYGRALRRNSVEQPVTEKVALALQSAQTLADVQLVAGVTVQGDADLVCRCVSNISRLISGTLLPPTRALRARGVAQATAESLAFAEWVMAAVARTAAGLGKLVLVGDPAGAAATAKAAGALLGELSGQQHSTLAPPTVFTLHAAGGASMDCVCVADAGTERALRFVMTALLDQRMAAALSASGSADDKVAVVAAQLEASRAMLVAALHHAAAPALFHVRDDQLGTLALAREAAKHIRGWSLLLPSRAADTELARPLYEFAVGLCGNLATMAVDWLGLWHHTHIQPKAGPEWPAAAAAASAFARITDDLERVNAPLKAFIPLVNALQPLIAAGTSLGSVSRPSDIVQRAHARLAELGIVPEHSHRGWEPFWAFVRAVSPDTASHGTFKRSGAPPAVIPENPPIEMAPSPAQITPPRPRAAAPVTSPGAFASSPVIGGKRQAPATTASHAADDDRGLFAESPTADRSKKSRVA